MSQALREMRKFSIVVAASVPSWGIGKNGTLPWKIPEDMKFFKDLTLKSSSGRTKNAVIMGRKTYLSIPPRFRPLPGRLNVVLTRNPSEFRASLGDDIPESVLICDSFEGALHQLNDNEYRETIEKVFVIGGSEVYNIALKNNQYLDTFYLTRVFADFECDTFLEFDPTAFCTVDTSMTEVQRSANGILFEFVSLRNRIPTTRDFGHRSRESVNIDIRQDIPRPLDGGAKEEVVAQSHPEYQYLNLIRDIIENGVQRPDRTGVGTLSKFGCTMRFSLRDEVFPLLTTKRVFWRGVAEELLWFVKGCTNANELAAKNIHIWDGNGSREFLDSRGLNHLEEGDLGAVYGFQWRHFGAKYTNMHANYDGQGVDQLKQVIETIKTNPTDRRMVMTAWNPAALHEMALPPCHMFCQFYVADGELSCQMYQRSCDMGLGVPFNIASYSLLTRMMAQVCGLRAGDFVHVLGDTHVYLNHVDPLKIQLDREPRDFPVLKINPEKKNIDDFVYEDFEIVGYKPHKRIKMQMAV